MKRKKNKIEQSGNNFQKLVETVRQLDKERREIQKTRASDGSDCSVMESKREVSGDK